MGTQDSSGAATPQGAGYDIGAFEYRTSAPDPAAPRLVGVVRRSDGSWRVQFTGLTGRSYLLERSADLKSWNLAGTADETSPGVYEFNDLFTGPAQFYRSAARAIPGG